jgi:hypothetical protein
VIVLGATSTDTGYLLDDAIEIRLRLGALQFDLEIQLNFQSSMEALSVAEEKDRTSWTCTKNLKG